MLVVISPFHQFVVDPRASVPLTHSLTHSHSSQPCLLAHSSPADRLAQPGDWIKRTDHQERFVKGRESGFCQRAESAKCCLPVGAVSIEKLVGS